jgi:hypothetical protein
MHEIRLMKLVLVYANSFLATLNLRKHLSRRTDNFSLSIVSPAQGRSLEFIRMSFLLYSFYLKTNYTYRVEEPGENQHRPTTGRRGSKRYSKEHQRRRRGWLCRASRRHPRQRRAHSAGGARISTRQRRVGIFKNL